MTTKLDREDYCKCSDDVPITWTGTCEQCGVKYLFPRGRPKATHPLPFDVAKQVLIDLMQKSREWPNWRGLPEKYWREAFHKLLDAEFLSIHKGFFLLGCGVFCNPRLYDMLELYFTDRRGAELWKELKYSKALYALDVCEKE